MIFQCDTEVFGEDVELFQHERFTKATPEKRLRTEHPVELSWGYVCSGKLVA